MSGFYCFTKINFQTIIALISESRNTVDSSIFKFLDLPETGWGGCRASLLTGQKAAAYRQKL